MLLKNKFPILCALFFSIIVISGCSKSNEEGSMVITFLDESNNPIPGVNVHFKNYYYVAATNGINDSTGQYTGDYTQISGSDGKVTFNGIAGNHCHWTATKGCISNNYMCAGCFPTLIPNGHNSATCVLYPMGVLSMIHTSTIPCNIFCLPYLPSSSIDGSNILNLSLKTRQYTVGWEYPNIPGSGRDSLVQISCGDTVRIYYPF